MRNLEKNVELNISAIGSDAVANACAKVRSLAHSLSARILADRASNRKGFTWGTPPDPLLEALGAEGRKFDLILLSDLVFNHSQHLALLNTCLSCLSTPSTPPSPASPTSGAAPTQPPVDLSDPATLSTPAVLCFFSHHRPWLVDADLQILSLARENGWSVTKVWEDPDAGVRTSLCPWPGSRVLTLLRSGKQPAFPEDEGDLAVRSTVHGWMFTRA